ncbi:MAG: DUF350 domain-containing protein [Spirochaetia bacterium]|jgi:uncharacterized membrane protein YjfL (UPF0719 family)|nr:DUF350 domain-containing protein [Spirochaetia bacterium]
MDLLVVLSGISTLLLSLLLGIFILFIGFKMFSGLSKNINEENEIKNNNIAVAILSGSFIFAMGIMMRSSVDPLIQSIFRAIFYNNSGISGIFGHLSIALLQFIASLFISISSLWLGLKGFTWLSHNINEFEEIQKNNIAVAILMASIIITLALFLQNGLEKLLQVLQFTPGLNNSNLTPFG